MPNEKTDQAPEDMVRGYMMMAALADHMDERVRTGGPLDLEGIMDRPGDEYVADLERKAVEISRRCRYDDTELKRLILRAGSGSAWMRSFNSTVDISRTFAGRTPTVDMFEEQLVKHTDLTTAIVRRPVTGGMIPTRLLPKKTFEKAVKAAVSRVIGSDLTDAVSDRIDDIAPTHQLDRLLFQSSKFLALIASSSREAEDAINMVSTFLNRFEDEDMIIRVSKAYDEGNLSDDVARWWTLQLMCTATFRMKKGAVMMTAANGALNIIDMPGGNMSLSAKSISIPLGDDLGDRAGDSRSFMIH